MSRPTTTLLIAALAALTATPAVADLNDLLGKWMDAASDSSDKRPPLEFKADIEPTPAPIEGPAANEEPSSSPSTLTAVDEPAQMELTVPTPPPTPTPATRVRQVEPVEQVEPESPALDYWSQGKSHTAHEPPAINENPYVEMPSQQEAGSCPTCEKGACDGPACGCKHRGCRSCCGQLLSPGDVGPVGLSECRPHHPPTLPPPSSLLEYFRSRNSYSDVWAGYAEETRLRCRNRSPHLNGTWMHPGCQGCGQLLEPHRHDARHCDSCDRAH